MLAYGCCAVAVLRQAGRQEWCVAASVVVRAPWLVGLDAGSQGKGDVSVFARDSRALGTGIRACLPNELAGWLAGRNQE